MGENTLASQRNKAFDGFGNRAYVEPTPRCIFCKTDSSKSKSLEHVIPESLWNTAHILPRGVVCDACNNYFARQVEKPFLESAAIVQLRFLETIPSKRGRVPSIKTKLLSGHPVELRSDGEGRKSMEVPIEILNQLQTGNPARLIVPIDNAEPAERVVSRFLAKMAIEAMALRLGRYPEGIAYIADEQQLDPLRNYARRGHPASWPHHARRIYPSDRKNYEKDGSLSQTVHEFDFLVTPTSEWYFVFALFGIELVINMGAPELDGYLRWLEENGDRSPLYPDAPAVK